MKSKLDDCHLLDAKRRSKEAERYGFPEGPTAHGVEAGLDLAIDTPPASATCEHAW